MSITHLAINSTEVGRHGTQDFSTVAIDLKNEMREERLLSLATCPARLLLPTCTIADLSAIIMARHGSRRPPPPSFGAMMEIQDVAEHVCRRCSLVTLGMLAQVDTFHHTLATRAASRRQGVGEIDVEEGVHVAALEHLCVLPVLLPRLDLAEHLTLKYS
jgi:hypothetical protein